MITHNTNNKNVLYKGLLLYGCSTYCEGVDDKASFGFFDVGSSPWRMGESKSKILEHNQKKSLSHLVYQKLLQTKLYLVAALKVEVFCTFLR